MLGFIFQHHGAYGIYWLKNICCPIPSDLDYCRIYKRPKFIPKFNFQIQNLSPIWYPEERFECCNPLRKLSQTIDPKPTNDDTKLLQRGAPQLQVGLLITSITCRYISHSELEKKQIDPCW